MRHISEVIKDIIKELGLSEPPRSKPTQKPKPKPRPGNGGGK